MSEALKTAAITLAVTLLTALVLHIGLKGLDKVTRRKR
jgi:hypothetical protein